MSELLLQYRLRSNQAASIEPAAKPHGYGGGNRKSKRALENGEIPQIKSVGFHSNECG
jgi:hypothetical protein